MQKILEGKTAIVTGASRGIGRSVALSLAGAGASVALASRSRRDLDRVKQEIASAGGKAGVFQCDISVERDIVSLVDETMRLFGGLDIVVNNAGMGIYGPLAETTAEDWDTLMAVNVRGPFLLCREAIPHLKGRGYIVNVASVVGYRGYENQSAYTASKHALMGMSKALAREVQSMGIRVHTLCPGGVNTDLVRQARPDLDPDILMAPQEIADVILFLVTRKGNAVIDDIRVRRESSTPFA